MGNCFMRCKSLKLEKGKRFFFPCLDVSAPWVRQTLCLYVAATNPTHTSTQKNSGTASTLCGSRHMAVGLRPARILLVQSLFPSIYKGLCGHTAGKSRVEAAGDQGEGSERRSGQGQWAWSGRRQRVTRAREAAGDPAGDGRARSGPLPRSALHRAPQSATQQEPTRIPAQPPARRSSRRVW